MSLTPSQVHVIGTTSQVTAFLGISGALGVFTFLYANKNALGNTVNRIVLAIAIGDLIDGIIKAVGRYGPKAGGAVCEIQASLMQYEIMACALLNVSMAIISLYIVYFQGTVSVIRKNEPFMFAFCGVMPLIPAFLVAFLQPEDGIPLYDDVQNWCWISKRYEEYRFYLWFGPLGVLFVINVVSYILVWWKLHTLAAENLNLSPMARKEAEMRQWMIHRMQTYLVAFIISWLPSTVNRLSHWFLPPESRFAFAMIHALLSPARGLIDLIAFLLTRQSKMQIHLGDIAGFASRWRTANGNTDQQGQRRTSRQDDPPRHVRRVPRAPIITAQARGQEDPSTELDMDEIRYFRRAAHPQLRLTKTDSLQPQISNTLGRVKSETLDEGPGDLFGSPSNFVPYQPNTSVNPSPFPSSRNSSGVSLSPMMNSQRISPSHPAISASSRGRSRLYRNDRRRVIPSWYPSQRTSAEQSLESTASNTDVAYPALMSAVRAEIRFPSPPVSNTDASGSSKTEKEST